MLSSSSTSKAERETQAQHQSDEILIPSTQMDQSETSMQIRELHSQIDVLKTENERLVRDYVLPPEYDARGSSGVNRSSSQARTLPPYDVL
ncbi:hypothetical protein VNI00_017301 [Paramarasmius palmivorus]|uniref:Uncharacterized protein n=1 Tax=Paramarasmius palmivorus TaxID=297713 RepID=A0AAW0BAF7_9AGAR